MKRDSILKEAQREVVGELNALRREIASELVVKGVDKQAVLMRRLERGMRIESQPAREREG